MRRRTYYTMFRNRYHLSKVLKRGVMARRVLIIRIENVKNLVWTFINKSNTFLLRYFMLYCSMNVPYRQVLAFVSRNVDSMSIARDFSDSIAIQIEFDSTLFSLHVYVFINSPRRVRFSWKFLNENICAKTLIFSRSNAMISLRVLG